MPQRACYIRTYFVLWQNEFTWYPYVIVHHAEKISTLWGKILVYAIIHFVETQFIYYVKSTWFKKYVGRISGWMFTRKKWGLLKFYSAVFLLDDGVIKWKHFPRYWPFVWGIHRSRWIPRTKASDAELWSFFHLHLNKRLSKRPRGWWFETPPWSSWRQCNEETFRFCSSILYIDNSQVSLRNGKRIFHCFPFCFGICIYICLNMIATCFIFALFSSLKLGIVFLFLKVLMYSHFS